MMEEKGFHVDLLSNSSSKFYPNNTTSNFTTKLHEPLDLKGDWTVAITEVFYPLSVYNLPESVSITLTYTLKQKTGFTTPTEVTGTEKAVTIPAGHYDTIEGLIKVLNAGMAKIWKSRDVLKGYNDDTIPKFVLHQNGFVRIEYGYEILAGSRLICYPTFHSRKEYIDVEQLLGFKKDQLARHSVKLTDAIKETPAKYEADIKGGRNFIFIYTDIIRERLVGDSASALLRTVPLARGKFQEIGYAEFNPPFYYDVSRSRIESIDVLLCDEQGHQLKFASGRVHINLHFKPKS